MKPFSALYYMKQNKKRSFLLVFMFVLTFAIYIVGLYVSNVSTMFGYSMERNKKTARIRPYNTDESYEDFYKAVKKLEEDKKITVLPQGRLSDIYFESIMNFNAGDANYSFRNKEDFETYCEFTGIKLLDKNKELGNGSVIMSSLQASNRGMELGDPLIAEEDEFTNQNYTLDAITDDEGYSIYYISDTDSAEYLVLNSSMDNNGFKEMLGKIGSEYNIFIGDNDYYKEHMDSQFRNFNYIYFFVIILLSIIMAVTINAAFAGMYQYRQGEFALYNAIGISKTRIRLKIISEVLLMDIAGIISGTFLIMLWIYLFNNLYLIEHGKMLFYYNNMSMAGMVVSNLVILIPVTFLQGRKLMKTDICNY